MSRALVLSSLLLIGSLFVQSNKTHAADTQPPTVPTGLTATAVSSSQINLSWTASTDDTGVNTYVITRDSVFLQAVPGNVTTYSSTGLTASTQYTYAVRATDAASNSSAYSSSQSATTLSAGDSSPPTTPSSPLATVVSATRVDFSWGASTDNVGVNTYVITRNGSAVGVVGSTTLSYSDTTVSPSTAYTYAVRATDAASNSSALATASSVTTPAAADTTAPTVPTGLAANVVSATRVDLTWTISTDASGIASYSIVRDGTVIGVQNTGTSTGAYSDITALGAHTYSYQVRATDGAGNTSANSSPAVSATTPAGGDTTPPTTPTNLAANVVSANRVDLTWTVSTDASGIASYVILRDSVAVGVQTSTSTGAYSDTTTSGSHTYSYQVRATDGAGNSSPLSTAASATTPAGGDTTPPTTPTSLAAVAVSASRVDLTWTVSTDASGIASYVILRDGTAVGVLTSTSTGAYSDTTTSGSTTYSYTVRATDGVGNSSAPSTAASVTTPVGGDTTPPSAPTNVSAAVISSSQVNLTWTLSTDNVAVTSYIVFRNDGTTGPVVVGSVNAPTVTFSDRNGLTSGASYTYTVRATDAAANSSVASAASSSVTIPSGDSSPPTAPATISATLGSPTSQINVSWGASTDNIAVTGYVVFRSKNGGSFSAVGSVTAPTTSFIDRNSLTSNSIYTYQVRATDAANNSSQPSPTSNSVTTPSGDGNPPTAPSNLRTTAVTSSQVSLAWDASTDDTAVTSYIVFRDSVFLRAVNTNAIQDTTMSAGTTHSYQVRASDAASNLSLGSNTLSVDVPAGTGGGGTTASTTPMVSNVSITVGTSDVTVSWTTDVPTTGEVFYGTSLNAIDTDVFDPVFNTFHNVSLTQLAAGTTYYFRVRSVDTSGDIGVGIQKSTAVSRAFVFFGGNTGGNFTSPLLRSNNDGLSYGAGWDHIQSSSESSYDWSLLDTNLAIAAQNGKGFVYDVLASVFASPPSWLATDGAAFYTYIKGFGSTATTVQDPVPWDTVFLSKFTTFLSALATHINSLPGASSFYGLSVSIPVAEMGLVGCRNVGGTWYIDGNNAPSNTVVYDRTRYLNAWKQMIDVYNADFPNAMKFLPEPQGEICRGDGDSSFYQQLLDYALSVSPTTFKPFATDLKYDGSVRAQDFLSNASKTSFAYQTTWSATNDPTFNMGPYTPAENLSDAITGTLANNPSYFEIYIDDMNSADSATQNAIALARASTFVTPGSPTFTPRTGTATDPPTILTKLGKNATTTPKTSSTTPSTSKTPSSANSTSSVQTDSSGTYTVRTTLSYGSKGTGVESLQKFLVKHKYLASKDSDGYFGLQTQEALKEFQCEYELVCSGRPTTTGWGATGPKTNEKLKKVSIQDQTTKITARLYQGVDNKFEVTLLQKMLARNSRIYPENFITGTFGSTTERAVERFQVKYGIVSSDAPGTPGLGTVGPTTRDKLNQLFGS